MAGTAEKDLEKQKHEAEEAKRKAEWEAKKKAREDEIQFAWEEAIDLPEGELIEKSVERVGQMTERLTKRNMKLCVTEYVQMMCYENPKIAQNIMHPRKCMLNCFKYINEKALEYLKQERKEMGEIEIDPNAIGGDVPDELCYQWAEEYFLDLEAKVDKTEADEEFKPKAFVPKTTLRSKKKEPAKKETATSTVQAQALSQPQPAAVSPGKKAEPEQVQMQLVFDTPQQMSLPGVA